jgi:multiple sugar transport system substrate-binding protein
VGGFRRVAACAAAAVVVLAAAACGGSSGGSSAASSTVASGTAASGAAPAATTSLAGHQITVFVPYKLSQTILDKFTADTGIKVTYVVTGWDAAHSKLVVADTARTYIADVAEFDWSFTGQFSGARWVDPLNAMLPASLLADLKNTDAAFTAGGNTYAACYSNDFRLSMYNKKLFAKAGIASFPTTLDELGADADKLKAAGVQYPISLPMAATEGGVTPWYLLTLALGGQLFDSSGKPAFTSPDSAGYKALQWEREAVQKGWVSPGAVSLDDGQALDKFTAGETAILLATGPGNLATANDPSQSKIAGDAEAALVPGASGPGASFGLPEGLSIPATAKDKPAAAAFIEWWEKPENATAIYKDQGSLPCGASTIQQLSANGTLLGGDVLSQELTHVQPLFPQGAPVWYSKFSSDAQGLLNAAFKGQMSVGDALSQLADKATAHANGQ